ncbi:hypothetical protein BGW36DRAFT_421379 [Talaromyces proteolyticus]|uniref:Clr5 domain-containing protein n=1 Tax=Talaromyces proteolyticus TaxID=1131652 RepID=A0AAD4Q377_9EURO|nr:uncharacterized protein BGW36DRAFT_421379 [Talaromyces proteolyticus]KAH8704784.1 hypothetical protein BGW36DRAFT_421379 [Talaromyces proteolyticus]
MKNAIPSDIWETKRILITKLYKDEEWPLKHVIKLIQTSDFCPSETQLRSRLKKWHVTKPSRKKYGSHKTRSEKSTSPESSQSSPFLSCGSGDMKQKLPIVHLEPFQYDRNSRKHDSIPPEKEEQSIPKLSGAEQHILKSQSDQYLTSLDTSVRQFPCTPGTIQDFLDRILSTSTPSMPSHCAQECTENTTLSEDEATDSLFQWQTNSIDSNMDSLNSRGAKDQTGHDMEMGTQLDPITSMDPSIADYSSFSVGCNHGTHPLQYTALLPWCMGGTLPCKNANNLPHSPKTAAASAWIEKEQRSGKCCEGKANLRPDLLDTIIEESHFPAYSLSNYKVPSPHHICPHSRSKACCLQSPYTQC